MKGPGEDHSKAAGMIIAPWGAKVKSCREAPVKGSLRGMDLYLCYLGGTAGNRLSSHIHGMGVFYFYYLMDDEVNESNGKTKWLQ